MSLPTPDFAAARNAMVDGQIRPNRVTDPRVLDAMRSLPREAFVPPDRAAVAYIDEDVPLGGGRVLMEPLVVARLVQMAKPRAGERALVVGAGPGYGAAVLAACGAQVTALEEDEAVLRLARQALPRLAPGVTLREGPLAAGLPGPWDIVMIEGAVEAIPAGYAEQLSPVGRIVAVVAPPGQGCGQAVLAEPVGEGLRSVSLFDAVTAPLPSLRPAPAFVF